MIINKHVHVITALLLFIGTIWAGQAMGLWKLKNLDISGETLIIEVSNKYGIPLETIYETWNIPEYVSPRAELAQARDEAGFSIGRFRIWAAAFKNKNELPPVESLVGTEQLKDTDAEINISGSTTIRGLSDNFGIPLEDIYRKFSLPESLPTDTTMKELRENYGVELGEIKTWVKIEAVE